MNSRKSILFVDDESRILDGLRRLLRPMNDRWKMRFAGSGPEALDLIARETTDVLVSDIRMPGMDGAELMERVKQQYPWVIRIALSGQTSQETVLRCVGPVHRYLPKPCDTEVLKQTIEQVCQLRNLLTDSRLQKLTSQLENLPCRGGLCTELMRELQTDDASLERICTIIARDVGMSAKVMHLVNSAFFGVRCKVTSIHQAVTLLGLETVRVLAISARVFGHFDAADLRHPALTGLWDHSLQVSRVAHEIASTEQAPNDVIERAALAGMLHDVGKLVFAAKLPDEYALVADVMNRQGCSAWQAEQEVLGYTHAEVGGYLLGLWGLPHEIVETLAYHHQPHNAPTKAFDALAAVHVANALAHGATLARPEPHLDVAYLQTVERAEQYPAWQAACTALQPMER